MTLKWLGVLSIHQLFSGFVYNYSDTYCTLVVTNHGIFYLLYLTPKYPSKRPLFHISKSKFNCHVLDFFCAIFPRYQGTMKATSKKNQVPGPKVLSFPGIQLLDRHTGDMTGWHTWRDYRSRLRRFKVKHKKLICIKTAKQFLVSAADTKNNILIRPYDFL